jgi:ATP-dependent DNA ligase
LPGSIVLDGELISPQGFQHLMTLIRRKEYHPDMALVHYAVFDILPLADFRMGHCSKSQRDRHAMLEMLQESGLWTDTAGRVQVVPEVEVDFDTADGQAAFAEFNRQAISDGYEGVMIKDPEAPYACKRTTAWLKRKPFIEVTLAIVGFEPGEPDGKYKDTLGALVCRGVDAGKSIASNVSGGISDALRDEIWQDQERFLGMMVEVRADKLTLEEGATIYSLRFPRLKAFRGRESMEIM